MSCSGHCALGHVLQQAQQACDCRAWQAALVASVTRCEKRLVPSHGGFQAELLCSFHCSRQAAAVLRLTSREPSRQGAMCIRPLVACCNHHSCKLSFTAPCHDHVRSHFAGPEGAPELHFRRFTPSRTQLTPWPEQTLQEGGTDRLPGCPARQLQGAAAQLCSWPGASDAGGSCKT